MIKIVCDKTGVSEDILSSQIEVREGKRQGEWVWVIKGIESLKNFDPRPFIEDLDMLLSKQAIIDWKKQEEVIIQQSKLAIKTAKEAMKQTNTNMTNKNPK